MRKKLSPGTIVLCLRNCPGAFTKGRQYIVGGSFFGHQLPGRIAIKLDDQSRPNGWEADAFEVVPMEVPWQ